MAERKQRAFATVRFDAYRRSMRREKFLGEMDQAMP